MKLSVFMVIITIGSILGLIVNYYEYKKCNNKSYYFLTINEDGSQEKTYLVKE